MITHYSRKVSKWHYVDNFTKELHAFDGIRPTTLKEAWDKTLTKWALFVDSSELAGYMQVETCGLCNLYWKDGKCDGCPIRRVTGYPRCGDTPLMMTDGYVDPTLEYLFLLLVKEATYKQRR